MTVNELSICTRTPIEVRSGYNGKLLCRAYNADKHKDIANREVSSVWAEIRATNSFGFSSYAKPIVCVYVSGWKEHADDTIKKEDTP